MQTWTGVFVAIIALNALVQAALVLAALFGMRMLNRSLDRLEDQVEQEVRPRVEHLTQVAARLVAASEAARARSVRIDTALTLRLGGLHRRLRRTVGRVGQAAEDAVADMDEAPGGTGGLWSSLILNGILRGFDAWRRSGGPADREAEPEDAEPVRER